MGAGGGTGGLFRNFGLTDRKTSLRGGYGMPGDYDKRVPKDQINEALKEKRRRRAAGLPIEHGFKYAFLGQTLGGGVGFVPLRAPNYRYGAEADAVCLPSAQNGLRLTEEHSSPDPHCSCGFYSLMLRRHLGSRKNFSWTDEGLGEKVCVLEVDVSGNVIEGDIGFRSSQIKVLTVAVNPICSECHLDAAGVALSELGPGFYVPSCRECANSEFKPLNWLCDQLRTEVVWDR